MLESELNNVHAGTRDNLRGTTILVTGRDSFSSDLLTTALSRSLGCTAISVPPSSLSKTIASGKATLAIIAADLRGIPGEGFELASSISHAHPDTGIIMLLNEASPEAVIRGFRSGARGVFCQEEAMTELLHCIVQVSDGMIWAGKRASLTLLDILKNIPSPGSLAGTEVGGSLTARELQVVQCAATGKTNRSIAAHLHLSEHTVKNYLFRAFAKLGVSSRVELLFYLSLRGHLAGQSIYDSDGSALAFASLSNEGTNQTSAPHSPSSLENGVKRGRPPDSLLG
jgi:two-component system nitrate/nitrite response regulator NarL